MIAHRIADAVATGLRLAAETISTVLSYQTAVGLGAQLGLSWVLGGS